MNYFKITLFFVLVTIADMSAQTKDNTFKIGPENVKVYSFEAATKGSLVEYEFEDAYTVKLTNKVYKINLLFEASKSEQLQQVVSRILEGTDASSGYGKMVWTRTASKGKPMYTIELKDNKLKIEVFRKRMDAEAYHMLNTLGQESITVINN
ncbi:hypothetical protein FGM00_17095 [Aggregatimonas sangjinii]|uniref:Uncharacterized protein n=1 Tax=Aggregatimonas sangjinii TaxID=2583587 RepID=A0A5B7ST83_9FLAO|nr:hypothetical protein [Aggregatimonas sangjinii]QCX01747.1 hypothetical protein FGM00_17095 [Aggregatimonas sangjinii]